MQQHTPKFLWTLPLIFILKILFREDTEQPNEEVKRIQIRATAKPAKRIAEAPTDLDPVCSVVQHAGEDGAGGQRGRPPGRRCQETQLTHPSIQQNASLASFYFLFLRTCETDFFVIFSPKYLKNTTVLYTMYKGRYLPYCTHTKVVP